MSLYNFRFNRIFSIKKSAISATTIPMPMIFSEFEEGPNNPNINTKIIGESKPALTPNIALAIIRGSGELCFIMFFSCIPIKIPFNQFYFLHLYLHFFFCFFLYFYFFLFLINLTKIQTSSSEGKDQTVLLYE